MKLTDEIIENFQPDFTERFYFQLSDGNGLYLRFYKTGIKKWVFLMDYRNKSYNFTLFEYNKGEIELARQCRDEIKKFIVGKEKVHKFAIKRIIEKIAPVKDEPEIEDLFDTPQEEIGGGTQRFNAVFSFENYDYLRAISGLRGMSMTQYLEFLVTEARIKDAETLARVREIREMMK